MRWLAPPMLLVLAACGQKGNLYLPDESTEVAPVVTTPAQPVAQPATQPATPAATAPAATAPEQDPDRDKPVRRN